MFPDYFPLDPRVYVREELKLRKQRRLQYSMRAFARDLEISPSFLCEFLAGRQGLSRARAAWIGDKLKLSQEQKEHFWDLLQSQFAANEVQKKSASVRVKARANSTDSHLRRERFQVIADWYHFFLLEILGLPNAPATLEEVSPLLDVPVTELAAGIERMKALGFLQEESIDGKTKYRVMSEVTLVGDDTPDRAIQLMHQQALQFNTAVVDRKPMSERENLTVAFSINQAQWPDLRNAISKAILDTIADYANAPIDKNQVASLTMQMITLMPITEGNA